MDSTRYRPDGCERCGGTVSMVIVDGRSAQHCDNCGIIHASDEVTDR